MVTCTRVASMVTIVLKLQNFSEFSKIHLVCCGDLHSTSNQTCLMPRKH